LKPLKIIYEKKIFTVRCSSETEENGKDVIFDRNGKFISEEKE
jgi:hypothetical protein